MNFIKRIVIISSILLFVQQSVACTAFSFYNTGHYTGKSFDYHIEQGYIIINPKGVLKKAMGQKYPAVWQSKYGSVTFNQYGREFPQSGMNEAGLVVEALWLNETRVGISQDIIESIDIGQWAQYQLDNAATVSDVISTIDKLMVIPLAPIKVHYYVSDNNGNAIIFEITEQKAHVHQPENYLTKCITNNSYEESEQFLRSNHIGNPGESLYRYENISREIKKITSRKSFQQKDIFKMFSPIKQGHTKWMIIYNHDKRVISYRTASNHAIREINFSDIDFTCTSQLLYADIIRPVVNSTSQIQFKPLTIEINKLLLEKVYGATSGLKERSAGLIDEVLSYLLTLQCK